MNITKEINRTMFREYDLRGIYKTDINEDVSYTIGRSFGSYLKEKNIQETVVGYDNRLSSPSIADAVIQGITDSGVDVITPGLVTTPMYYYTKYFYKKDTGIMITASHNPKEYNGFKISFDAIGNAYGQSIQDFYEYTIKGNFQTGKGNVTFVSIEEDYINFLLEKLTIDKSLKVVIDCGNGTGAIIAKQIFDRLGITYYPLYCESDGNFPNHHPDPSIDDNMRDLQQKVLELNYDVGLAFDGDADRIGVVDNQGNIIKPDIYMLLMARDLKNNLNENKLLFDVKCSKSLIDELEKLNITPVMYRTGASYTNRMVKEGNFTFGGEYSGHVFFRDKWPGFDDGIYAGLRLLELLSKEKKPFHQLLEGINPYYFYDYNMPVEEDKKEEVMEKVKQYVDEKGYNYLSIDGVRVTFLDGWVLIRKSNTTPILTIRFEAKTETRVEELKKEFLPKLESFL